MADLQHDTSANIGDGDEIAKDASKRPENKGDIVRDIMNPVEKLYTKHRAWPSGLMTVLNDIFTSIQKVR